MISLVAAMTKDRVIGIDGKLPWHIKSESEHYHEVIRGKTVIRGRNTFNPSKRDPFAGHTIVVTHTPTKSQFADMCASLEEALAKAQTYGPDVIILGGESIFNQSIGIADRMQLSYIKKDYPGNKFFPKFDANEWKVDSREDFPEFEYVVYTRKNPK